MLALTEIRKVRVENPMFSVERAAAIRSAVLGGSASYDFQNAVTFARHCPGVLEGDDPDLDGTCRRALHEMVLHMISPWARHIPRGSDIVRQNLKDESKNVLQCFEYGKLFEQSAMAFSWWDELEMRLRTDQNEKNALTGRIGEDLSMQHEADKLAGLGRPDLIPEWTARKNTYAGYDIESYDIVDGVERNIYIEVKTCTRPPLSFHLTPKEVKVARSKMHTFYVHLWDLSTKTLQTISANQIETHIPDNNGSGIWTDVLIYWSRAKQASLTPFE